MCPCPYRAFWTKAQEFVISGANAFYNDINTYMFFTHSSISIAIQPGLHRYYCSIQAEKSGFTLVKIGELFSAAFGKKISGNKTRAFLEVGFGNNSFYPCFWCFNYVRFSHILPCKWLFISLLVIMLALEKFQAGV